MATLEMTVAVRPRSAWAGMPRTRLEAEKKYHKAYIEKLEPGVLQSGQEGVEDLMVVRRQLRLIEEALKGAE